MNQPAPTVRRSGSFGPAAIPAAAAMPFGPQGRFAWGTGYRVRFGILPCAYQVGIQEQPQRRPVAFYAVQNAFCGVRLIVGNAQATVFLASGAILSGYGPETIAYSDIVLGPFTVNANNTLDVSLPAWTSNQCRQPAVAGMLEIWADKPIVVSGSWALVASDPVQSDLNASFLQFIEPIGSSPRA
jgi:hypothetical protein